MNSFRGAKAPRPSTRPTLLRLGQHRNAPVPAQPAQNIRPTPSSIDSADNQSKRQIQKPLPLPPHGEAPKLAQPPSASRKKKSLFGHAKNVVGVVVRKADQITNAVVEEAEQLLSPAAVPSSVGARYRQLLSNHVTLKENAGRGDCGFYSIFDGLLLNGAFDNVWGKPTAAGVHRYLHNRGLLPRNYRALRTARELFVTVLRSIPGTGARGVYARIDQLGNAAIRIGVRLHIHYAAEPNPRAVEAGNAPTYENVMSVGAADPDALNIHIFHTGEGRTAHYRYGEVLPSYWGTPEGLFFLSRV